MIVHISNEINCRFKRWNCKKRVWEITLMSEIKKEDSIVILKPDDHVFSVQCLNGPAHTMHVISDQYKLKGEDIIGIDVRPIVFQMGLGWKNGAPDIPEIVDADIKNIRLLYE